MTLIRSHHSPRLVVANVLIAEVATPLDIHWLDAAKLTLHRIGTIELNGTLILDLRTHWFISLQRQTK